MQLYGFQGGGQTFVFSLKIPLLLFLPLLCFLPPAYPNPENSLKNRKKPYPWANEEKKAEMQFMARTMIRHFRRPTLSARPPQINAPNIIPRNTIKPAGETINHVRSIDKQWVHLYNFLIYI